MANIHFRFNFNAKLKEAMMLRRIQWTTALILIQCLLISVGAFAAEEPEEG